METKEQQSSAYMPVQNICHVTDQWFRPPFGPSGTWVNFMITWLPSSVGNHRPKPLVPGQIQVDTKPQTKMHPPDSASIAPSSMLRLVRLIMCETHPQVHGHAICFPQATSWCVDNCSRPTVQGSVTSGSTIWYQESVEFPIPRSRNRRLLRSMVLMLVGHRLAVCTDRAVTCGKHCGSTLDLVGLICNHSGWWPYIPCTVQCVSNGATFMAGWFGSAHWKVTIFLLQ